MAVKVGEAFVDVTARLDEYNKRLLDAEKKIKEFQSKANKSTKSIGDSISDIGKKAIGIYTAIKGLNFVFNDLIGAASDFEETNNKFKVVFQEVAEEAEQMSNTLVQSYGLSTLESKTLLSATGDLLTGLGMTGESALDLSGQVQKLAVDLASFANVEGGAERASQALTAALLGEREQAKDLGIIISEEMVKERLAAESKSNLTGMALLQAKAEATLAISIEQSKNAIGDFERSASSYANQQRTLTSLLKDMAVVVGTPLKDALSSGQSALLSNRDAIIKFTEVLAKGASGVAQIAGIMANFVTTALSPFLSGMNEGKGVTQILSTALDSVVNAFKEMEPIILLIAEAIAFLIQSIMQFVEILNETFGPALKSAINNLIDFKNVIVDVIDEMRGIEHEFETLEELAGSDQPTVYMQKQQKAAQAASKEWKKARSEAQKFATDLIQSMESPAQTIARVQEENLAKLEDFRKRRFISEQQYQEARIAINQDAENKILELKKQRHEQEMQLADQSLSKTGEMLGLIGEAFAVSEQNRLTEIDQRRQKKLNELQITFEQERDNIRSTIKNKKKQEIAINKLEENRAKKERQINEKSEKEKAKIQRQAFERQKGFRIVETIMATSQAIMSALSGPWPASIAFAALAGVMGAVQLGIIASQKPPAMAEGGIANSRTFAEIGEAGPEAVFPLTGPQGAKTREMFANDLINAIGGQQDRIITEEAGVVPEAQQMTFNVHVNIGGEQLYGTITQGIENRQILIDANALVKI